MKYDKTNIPHIHWIALLFIVSAVGWSIYESQVKDNHIEQMGDIMDLRGTTIVAIRVLDPAQSALQRLDIYAEGGAAASVIPGRVGVRVRRLALTSTDMSDLELFRQRWCANPKPFAAPIKVRPSMTLQCAVTATTPSRYKCLKGSFRPF